MSYEFKKTHTPATKFDPHFGGYEWYEAGIMKQYKCIRTYEDAMDVIENICKLNPKMKSIKRAVKSLKPM